MTFLIVGEVVGVPTAGAAAVVDLSAGCSARLCRTPTGRLEVKMRGLGVRVYGFWRRQSVATLHGAPRLSGGAEALPPGPGSIQSSQVGALGLFQAVGVESLEV